MKKLVLTGAMLLASTTVMAKAKKVSCSELVRYAEKHKKNEAMLINNPWKGKNLLIENLQTDRINAEMFSSTDFTVVFTCMTYNSRSVHVSGSYNIKDIIIEKGIGTGWTIPVDSIEMSKMGWAYITLK